jgi:2'-5' RNA ligase
VHLTASILPPDDVLDHIGAALRDDLAETELVAWEHRARWRVRLADFGMVVREDAVRVSECLTERVAGVVSPTLRLEEVRPLPLDGDDSIWVGIGGDADLLRELAAGIPQWIHVLGFVPDRRSYYSGIRLGRVTATTTVPYLEGLASRLGGYEGPAWTASDVLLTIERASGPDHPPRFDVFEPVPFAAQPIGHGGAHVHPVGDKHA